ncbi:MAG: hypothetical protein ACYCQJ_07465 [Nitrososphaerales archaeon]
MSIKLQTLKYGTAAIAIAAIIIVSSIVVGPLGKISSSTSTGTASSLSNAGSIPLLVQLTDPPNVPTGTQSLNLTYNNLDLHVLKDGAVVGWVKTGSSGTVNLQSLVNVSKTIGIARIPNGSSVDQIRFDIVSVSINVNGTVYNVSTPSNTLIAPIAGGNKLENLSSTLLELSPTVTETSAGNATVPPTFVLVPSATAVILSHPKTDQATVGAEAPLTSDDRAELEGAKGNVSIEAASLSVSGNRTMFSLTIKNTGNMSVALQAVTVHGRFNVSSTTASTCVSSTSTTKASEDSGDLQNPCGEHEVEYPNEIVFALNSSNSLVPFSGETSGNSTTLVLQPGQSVSLTFNGTITLIRGDTGSQYTITAFPILGAAYSIQGEFSNDAHAIAQVNATA